MKILYGVQGTGNGHITRAAELIPAFRKYAEVDVLISGDHAELSLPFDVKYSCGGLGFYFGKKGGVDYYKTYKKGKVKKFFKEIKIVPVEEYDLVISDFEPVSAWAARIKNIPCVGLSNQCTLNDPRFIKADNESLFAQLMLKKYAPVNYSYGFFYEAISSNVFTPVIRKEIRELKTEERNHYIVYLPFYSDERIIRNLSVFYDVSWKVFSKHSSSSYVTNNVSVYPINKDVFLEMLRTCTGVICAAGFATTSEALFLNKKLLVIPMKNQFEQQCNASALKKMGVKVIKSLKRKRHLEIEQWLDDPIVSKVNYPPIEEEVVQKIIGDYQMQFDPYSHYITQGQFSLANS